MRLNLSEVLALQNGEVHLWHGLLDQWAKQDDQKAFRRFLNASERDRAERFHFARDCMSFVVSHGLLRIILSRYVGADPSDIDFANGAFGRPELAKSYSGIRFNLSHTKNAVMIGVTLDGDIGVDIEHVRSDNSLIDIANRSFAASEVTWITEATPTQRRERFFTIWTLKEAYLKARGLGLNSPLNSFEVHPGPKGNARLSVNPQVDPASERWVLRHLQPFADYRAAVSVARPRGVVLKFMSREILRRAQPGHNLPVNWRDVPTFV